MKKTILQVPMDSVLRQKAEEVALSAGFSSVQEVVRVFLTKLASQSVEIKFVEKNVLSREAERRYKGMINDIQEKTSIVKGRSVKELMGLVN